MEDLYSNLENYDDVNAVDELKIENRELKHKLDECSKAMNQLQKDFDKINSEYKKLEINYSSLLKTARAEIERKTQLITNLNKEKDMIVIKAMQGGCRNLLQSLNKPVYQYKKNEEDGKNKAVLKKNIALGLSEDSREGSRESPLLLMKENMAVPATNKSTSSEQCLKQFDDGHSKENVKSTQHETKNSDKPKSARISDRRKSMPVLSNWEDQISSEEEEIKENYTKMRDLNKYQDFDNFRQNLQYFGSKREPKSKRSERFPHESKQIYNKHIDRYNPHFDRHTYKHYDSNSPERARQQPNRGNEYSHRPDYYRQRVLESPPKDKYNRSKSRERRHRERDRRCEFDYYNSRYEDNYDARSIIREPDLKRRRMDLSHKDRERQDNAAERRSYRLSEYRPDVASENHMSCQSPDYDQIESNLSHHYVKEIKNTATVQLEDPRINSIKYSLKESDHGTFLTTVKQNICMIPVDKALWGMEKVEVPEALKANIWEERANEDIVNNIYSDIVDAANSSSVIYCKNSSGGGSISKSEILGNPDDHNSYSNECPSEKLIQELQKSNISKSESKISDYKIPKKSMIAVTSITSKQENSTKSDFKKNLSHNEPLNILNAEARERNIYKLKSQQIPPVEHDVEGDLELSDEASDVTDELQITCKQNDKLTIQLDKVKDDDKCLKKDENIDETRKNVKTIQGDDMTHKKPSKPVVDAKEKGHNMQVNLDSENTSSISLKKKFTCKKKTSQKKYDGKSPQVKDIKTFEKTIEKSVTETKETKKREKRKRLSSKETEKEKKESKPPPPNTQDMEHENKPKGSKPHDKFTELFGESSSLITPEDLNIPTKFNISMERNDNYGSLFENTQDAIDLNVTEIKEVPQADISNLKVLENIEALSVKEDSNVIDKKSLFEINSDHVIDNAFKNLKPAIIDDETNVVKTVVISSGTQPCIDKKVTDQKLSTVIESTIANDAEKKIEHRPLELLRAVATSTPNKMQHKEIAQNSATVSPNGLNNDTKLSYSASLLTTTNDEARNNAPDVRIFIKRRRKIKKT